MKWRIALLAGFAVAFVGCTSRTRDGDSDIRTERGVPPVRVALGGAAATAALSGTGDWTLTDARGATIARGRAGDTWSVERRGAELRAVRSDGDATPWRAGPLTQRPARGEFVRHSGRRYRGVLRAVASGSGVQLVNVLSLEDYLRGVVPLEIGERPHSERAAVEAQAIAARSYTVVRLGSRSVREAAYDVQNSTADQVYGGRDAERAQADDAIAATAGRVLLYGGRAVSAPFHSACGGETAAAEEVWSSDGEPHLRRVSDKISGSDRYYCDIAPRFAWTREISGTSLNAVVARYLDAYATLPVGGTGTVEAVTVNGRTPSGRVAEIRIRTARGQYAVRGNDARSVLRTDAGELLPSAYFSVATEQGSAGGIGRLVIRGNGYGHGVGMCQWGAIGRARAGQSARTILRTYYPGTVIGRIPAGLLTS